ncbi:hypothetical protein GIB67_033623 [Kingdonia uniflora]|uniref:2-C-methyl-D-erythritol 4-phosphate cytidylyltransferase n=1 Tax=Kingdonia uniflora TaxID=39325 RepID=A0A7J7LAN3_9MAGN|nr:hypothetical protein GIB67_033623 [Kingdonia uniflora]
MALFSISHSTTMVKMRLVIPNSNTCFYSSSSSSSSNNNNNSSSFFIRTRTPSPPIHHSGLINCCAKSGDQINEETVKHKSVSVLLLAGGKGKRMGANMPKQYLPLLGQPIALYSFYTFAQMIQVKEIIVVCDPSYRDIFQGIIA